jgi:16S rRNA (cytidine1402-2'-O)-methyltransferase
VVATPLGNLEDLSPRARRILGSATIIAAEDTRTSGLLVRLAGGAGKLVSLTDHNVEERTPSLLTEARSSPVALVSDAGTPAISDPGTMLVEAAHREGVRVFAVPGASALVAALSVSGFPAAPSTFLGFLPKNRGERLRLLEEAAKVARTLVVFENPGRLPRMLQETAELFEDPEVVVCRELTKMHEEVARGRAAALAAKFANTRGECTVVVHVPRREADRASEEDLLEYLGEMKRAGARRAGAAAEAARRFHVTREQAYEAWERAPAG